MWTYNQRNGDLLHNASLIGQGYSGADNGKNNPDMQHVPEVGPIPKGVWLIGPVSENTVLGPHALPLQPRAETNTFGRSGFWIHGDSIQHPGHGSCGCIVIDPYIRGRIAESTDRWLQVV